MLTEQEGKVLREAFESADQLQAQWREDAERDPSPVYAELLREAKLPVKYLLYLNEDPLGSFSHRRSRFMVILDKPDEDALTKAFRAEAQVISKCIGQDIKFDVKQTYSGTEQDVEKLIKTGYAVV